MLQFQKRVRKHDQLKEENKWMERKEINTMQWKLKKKKHKTNLQIVTNLKYYIT